MAGIPGDTNKIVYEPIRKIRRARPLGMMALLVVVLPFGCASLPPMAVEDADFAVGGRLAVRDDAERFSASFSWLQRRADYSIELWGPFGAGRVRVRGNEDRVTITTARGDFVRGVDPDLLMRAELGWSIPLDAMASWIRGVPVGKRPFVARQVTGERLDSFEQDGWSVEFDRFRNVDGSERPGRILAVRGPSRIVVVVRTWQAGPER